MYHTKSVKTEIKTKKDNFFLIKMDFIKQCNCIIKIVLFMELGFNFKYCST